MDETKRAVLELAQTHYAQSDEPLYLASVGQSLRVRALWPIEGETRSLRGWLKSLEPDIRVLQDETNLARVAIAPPNKAESVNASFTSLRAAEFLSSLARPVLLAFVVRGEEEKPVFVTRRPPFKYTVVPPADRAVYHVIAPEYRLAGMRLAAVAKMPADDVRRLAETIQRWALANGVALETLTREVAEAEMPVPDEVALGTMSALERLVAAQRPDLRHQVVIPADIAALLSRHR